MSKANFYYDEVMNEDLTTFSIYLYTDSNSSARIYKDYSSTQAEEILRGVISQDASMGSQIIWNGSPLNLTSAWANLATNLKESSRNLINAANAANNAVDTLLNQNGRVLNWDQNAYYSINEFQKTFGGITTSTPLTVSAMILPYINSKGVYRDVKSQLEDFLGVIYKNEKQESSTNEEINITSSTNESKESWIVGLIRGVGNAVASGLNWISEQIDNLSSDILGSNDHYMIKLAPPHGYSGVPIDFIEGMWMANTLALRIGKRQLYNLLIGSISVTISKEQVYYNNKSYPSHAQVELSFQPVLVLKPSEIKDYILYDNLVDENSRK